MFWLNVWRCPSDAETLSRGLSNERPIDGPAILYRLPLLGVDSVVPYLLGLPLGHGLVHWNEQVKTDAVLHESRIPGLFLTSCGTPPSIPIRPCRIRLRIWIKRHLSVWCVDKIVHRYYEHMGASNVYTNQYNHLVHSWETNGIITYTRG